MPRRSQLATILLVAGYVLIGLLQSHIADAFDPVEEIPSDLFYLMVDGHELVIPYVCNRELDTIHPEVRRAVIMLHGGNRLALNDFSQLEEAAADAGNAAEYTLLLTPQFLYWNDVLNLELPAEYLYWQFYEWYIGELSGDADYLPRPAQISSFAIIDSLMLHVAEICPNLGSIVLGGNSAGGKFTSLYALGGNALDDLPRHQRPKVHYMPVNTGHFLYVTPERRVEGEIDQFELPPQEYVDICPTYNQYPFGLNDLNSYMQSTGALQILRNLKYHQIVYLVGEYENIDVSTFCEAYFQGDTRLERLQILENYYMHVAGYWPENLVFHVVPGAGHSMSGIYSDNFVQYYLFQHNDVQPERPPAPFPDERGQVTLTCTPNPFNASTSVRMSIPESAQLKVTVFNTLGQQVAELVNGRVNAGTQTLTFDASDLSSGIYFIEANVPDHFNQIQKVTLLK
jgi:Secretion system C-terminal sorting domain